ncbi:MAG: transcriptional regulator [Chloroflexaceae bacterium]|nr:transcriptional regulator [Chloroflexaceae bacterium]
MVDQRVTNEFIDNDSSTDGSGTPYEQRLLMTRLTPPPQQTRLLTRSRVDMLLSAVVDYPLTVLVSPAGSGKTTALANIVHQHTWPAAWCRMSTNDDTLSLMSHLIASFRGIVSVDEERIYTEVQRAEQQGSIPDVDNPGEVISAASVALDLLVNELASGIREDTMLVLDDYHYVDEQPQLRGLIERLIAIQPARLHVLLATRYEPRLVSLPTARARGEVYWIDQAALSFTVEETQALFELCEQPVPADVAELTAVCRGWPLVLQMIVVQQLGASGYVEESTGVAASDPHEAAVKDAKPQRRWSNTACPTPPDYLKRIQTLLDEYLTDQVLTHQPTDIQQFLLHTADFRWLDRDVCQALPVLGNVVPQWVEVQRRNLFIESVPTGQMTYQPIFRAFLSNQADAQLSDMSQLHHQATDYYRQKGDYEGVMHHLLYIDAYDQAADVLEQAAPEWLRQGRATALLNWLVCLPEAYHQRPLLLEAQAAANRRLGRFEQALTIYQQAESAFAAQGNVLGQARALRGRAEVYVDTVQPAPAVILLKQAMKLLPRERYRERSELLRLQAENWANRGRADIALKLETCARQMAQPVSPDDANTDASAESTRKGEIRGQNGIDADSSLQTSDEPSQLLLLPRLMLRSGRLNEARHELEAELGLEATAISPLPPSLLLAHREPALLLALLYTLLGYEARALAMARRGLLEATQSESLLTEAIAHMRVGHAYQVITPLDTTAANRHYRHALELVQSIGVTRTKVEAYMGLALLNGHSGDLGAAEVIARDALKIAEESGDAWIGALTWLALGSAAVAVEDERALDWLGQAQQRFVRGGDSYGQAVVHLWLSIWYLRRGNDELMTQHVARLLDLSRSNGYEGLMTAPTLFGPRDLAMLIPLLLKGRSLADYTPFTQQLLRQAFPSIASDDTVEDYHPGYTLRIQMLGSFRVWRGNREIQAREWQREKARQLLQLLLTFRGQWLQREQICAWLWPDSDLEAAERQFKVTLNALNTALEPLRPPRTAPFFIRRQGLAYSFAPSYGCWIDVDEFELRTTTFPHNDPEFVLRNSQITVHLYRGDYLAESLYDPWTLEERERLLARYLATATALAAQLVDRGDMQQAVYLCERVLRRDRCYEEAYQVLMRAYARSGSRSQAMRTYLRCEQAMQDELGIEPLPETNELYEQIKRNEKV